MKRIFSAILSCALCVPLFLTSARAASDPVVRVGLAYGASAQEASRLEAVDGAGWTVGEMRGTSFVSRETLSCAVLTVEPDGTGLRLVDADDGRTVYETDADELALSARGGLTLFGQNRYEGDFVCRNTDGRVTVINYIGLEDYIKGVVPYEMTASWPREALKAQAVCVRSYADGQMGKHESQGFDLCASTHCETYRGTGRATANSDAAVEETEGEYLWYNGKKVVGYYFSSDGGATEDAANVWGGSLPYLTGVPDPYENTAEALNGTWSVALTAAQAAEKLRAAGHTIGTVASIQITGRTAMGNVAELTVTDTAGTKVKLTRAACRSVFGLNSIRYSVSGGTSAAAPAASNVVYVIGADGVKRQVALSGCSMLTSAGLKPVTTAAQTTDTSATGDSFTFTGTGWGHSVGMSQYGAKAMAEQGFPYDRILQYYFTGIEVR